MHSAKRTATCRLPLQSGATMMFAAVGASRLIVPPLILIMQRRPPPLQSSSSSHPGKTPRLAIWAQVFRSPLMAQTRTRPWKQVSDSGRIPWCLMLHVAGRWHEVACSSGGGRLLWGAWLSCLIIGMSLVQRGQCGGADLFGILLHQVQAVSVPEFIVSAHLETALFP